ncbi:hypothetical protein NQZ68_014815, partial [Dissostichus eleginoides]
MNSYSESFFTCGCLELFHFPSQCCTRTRTEKLSSTCTALPGVNRRSHTSHVVHSPSCGERLTVASDVSVLSRRTHSKTSQKMEP